MLKAVSSRGGSGGGGVLSLNGETGALTLTSSGGSILITTPTANTINLEAVSGGSGTVTSVSGTNANGVSFTITNPTTTPDITISLGAITPSSVNGLVFSSQVVGFTIAGGTTSKTLTVPLDASVSGTNTGDVSFSGENYLSLTGQAITASPVNLGTSNVTGNLPINNLNSGTGATSSTFWRGDGTWATPAGTGVTAVSVASSNGFAGSSSGGTTPTLTLSTTVTGLLKGNGTAISAASAGTDYQAPISLTTTGTSGAATFIANTLNIPQYQAAGTYVTSVTGTTDRITSSGGTTPAIDIASTYVGQTSITTLGTIGTGTWNATTIAVNKGGTGQTSYTDGQLLIGNTTGNTLTKATLTAGSGVSILNGNGSITISATGTGGTVTSVAMTGDGVIYNSTVSGSPVTTSGTLAPALLTQTANTVLAGPTTGSPATPTFRALVSGDIPSLSSTYVPYTGATANVDLGTFDLITDTITSKSSSGLILENNAGGDVLHIGNGGGVNATAYGGWNFDAVTASTLAGFGGSKTLSSAGTTGSTDNAILRADGTGGATVQSSPVTIADTTGVIAGTQGVTLSGSTSGTLAIRSAAIAGTNTLTLPAGTTDFSATGGASQVVRQSSAGGAFTVSQLAASDLSNGTTGSGSVVLNTAPTFASTLTVGTPAGTTGAALFRGTTSGTVTLSVADAAGTWTMKLPTSAGSPDYYLKTDGSGNTSWASVSAGSSAFNDITSGTNTTAAMVVGTGASLSTSGSGTITATSAATVNISNEATDTTCFLLFSTASGTQTIEPKNNTGLTYNSSTNNLGATTFTGALSGNATTATTLATPRAIYGNNFDGSAALTQIIASTYGGTGNGFTKFSGATTSEKTYTLPNATCNILTDNAVVTVAQGGTGRNTSTTAYGLIAAGTTATGAHQTLAAGATTEILVGGGASALPVWTTATGSGAPVRATSPSLTTPNIGAATATSIDTGSGAIANIYSRTYTPTLTGVANVSASSAGQAFYMRIGDVVHVSMRINITPTAAAPTSTSIRITIPVSSNLTTTGSLNGVGRNRSTVTFQVGTVYADTTNDAALLIFDATSTSNLEWNMTFTYLVA